MGSKFNSFVTTRACAAAMLAILLQPGTAQAISISAGETVRSSYSFGFANVEPSNFFLQLSNSDAFGMGDAIAISFLSSSLTKLTETQLTSTPTQAIDPTVVAPFSPTDYLSGVLGPTDPPRIPQDGFVEITTLAGSVDLLRLRVFAFDHTITTLPILREIALTEFERVVAPVPVPATGALLLSSMMIGLGATKRRKSG